MSKENSIIETELDILPFVWKQGRGRADKELNFPKNSRLILKAKKFSLPEQCLSLREEISKAFPSLGGTTGTPCSYSLVLVITESDCTD